MPFFTWFTRLLRWHDEFEGSDLFADLDPT